MMRYQRVSPDCVSLPNPRKPSSITSITTSPLLDPKPLRVRSGSGSTNPTTTTTQTQTQTQTHDLFPSTSDQATPEPNGRCSVTGDVLLQWGHNKRSRGSRAENRTVGDEFSSVHSRQMIKIQRRAAAIAGAEKIAAAAAASAMPPPSRGANLRACVPHNSNRSVEERSGGQSRSEKRSSPSPPNKVHHHSSSSSNHRLATAAVNGFGLEASSSMNPESKPDQEVGGGGGGGPTAASTEKEKVNLEHFEWPRIYISLSRKEKEDDFLAMKGTKLPQRPKKRAKNVDKTLQYCFPGMWLSDLTRGRYEVREKKSVKKLQKRRGLKGMECMDSDSE